MLQRRVKAVWSAEMAYVVGLIATDGCLTDGRHISITSKDIDLLITVLKCLNALFRITKKFNGRGDLYWHIQIGDRLFNDWLVSIGLTPRKSKTLGPIKVPDDYYADFLRGCIDGDGSIYGYWDKRWPNSYMYYLSLTSASPVFLRWIRARNSELYGVVGHITRSTRAEQLKYAKAEAKNLHSKVYYRKNAPCLERKRLRFLDIFALDPY